MTTIITIQITDDGDHEWDEHDLREVSEAALDSVNDLLHKPLFGLSVHAHVITSPVVSW